jgi:hypothetical protein
LGRILKEAIMSQNQSSAMDRLNWNYILTHPSEFVRLDEHLRLKQIELDGFHSRMVGWTKLQHKNIWNIKE